MFEFLFQPAIDQLEPVLGTFWASLITAILIVIAFFIVALMVRWVFKKLIHRWVKESDSELDDLIVKAVSQPLIIGIVMIGVFIGLTMAPGLDDYQEFIDQLFLVFYILFGAFVAVRVISAFITWWAIRGAKRTKTKIDDHFLPFIRRIVMAIVLFFAFVLILGVFGIELTAFVALIGVGGIAVALAFQDTLKELFAGTYVILDKPIKIGDLIELESGDRGIVHDIGWRSTIIKTWSGNYVTLPNSKIADSKLINYTEPAQEVGFSVEGGVGYHEDLDRVEKVLVDEAKKVLKKVGCGAKDWTPIVRYQQFGDSNIDFKVVFRVNTFGDQYLLKHEFIKAIKKRFDKEGIEISWPVRKVYSHKGKGK